MSNRPRLPAFSDRKLSPELRAKDLAGRLHFGELLDLTGGHRDFFIAPLPRFGLPAVRFADASMGVRLSDAEVAAGKLSTAFPASVALAATWNPELAREYAGAVAEECRAHGIGTLLGPGVNIYRTSTCGRNFEYLGEDPFLTSRLAVGYIKGLQSAGVMACVKHFACNNQEWLRHDTDSRVGSRAFHEIYLPAFKAAVQEAGVMAVMTAYNYWNGEKASQNRALIEGVLQRELRFRNLVMSDWGGVWDGAKALASGQHLVMPDNKMVRELCEKAPRRRKALEKCLRRMALGVLGAVFKMGFYDRPRANTSLRRRLSAHRRTALETALQAVTLLKNGGMLPLAPGKTRNLLLTGPGAEPSHSGGGGSGAVAGYGHTSYLQGLRKIYGKAVAYVAAPSDAQLARAGAVLVCPYVHETESEDRWFELPGAQERLLRRAVRLNPRTAVILTQGGGLRMGGWLEGANAVVQAYFLGQCRGEALAAVLSGRVNPGGKLPFSIEREFADSPAARYLPAFRRGRAGGPPASDRAEEKRSLLRRGLKLPYPIEYAEGVLVGYRWYDAKGIAPQFPFGHGLSYTRFEYSGLKLRVSGRGASVRVAVEFSVRNSGSRAGSEVAQVYVSDPRSRLARPPQELKAFQRLELRPAQTVSLRLTLDGQAFSYYDPSQKDWILEPGEFVVRVGASSRDLRLRGELTL